MPTHPLPASAITRMQEFFDPGPRNIKLLLRFALSVRPAERRYGRPRRQKGEARQSVMNSHLDQPKPPA